MQSSAIPGASTPRHLLWGIAPSGTGEPSEMPCTLAPCQDQPNGTPAPRAGRGARPGGR
jgi:hypothetical protein